ncbi:MAG: type I restriction endonuclease subunit R [Cyanobacteria bacterium P01_G01_bin.54]
MTTFLTVTETIKTIADAEARFGLRQNRDRGFFAEWQASLPPLTPEEEANCDRIRASYLHNSFNGSLTEATINLLLVSPLVYLAGFCDPPYTVQGEKSVTVEVTERDEVYRGRIDFLILKQRFWLAIVESKQTQLSFSLGIPQLLTYMMANPYPEQSTYGLVTNGDSFLFVKLAQVPTRDYAFSSDFSVYGLPENELYAVLQIMRAIDGQIRLN